MTAASIHNEDNQVPNKRKNEGYAQRRKSKDKTEEKMGEQEKEDSS